MKKFLYDLISRKREELDALKKRSDSSENIQEVRDIGARIDAILEEIRNAENQLTAIETKNSFDPVAAVQTVARTEVIPETDRSTMEYRKAFMNFVQRGEKSDLLQYEKRDSGVAADLGVLLPQTVIETIISDVEKVYGQLYARVKKTNIKGGVKYPIGGFTANFTRITESTVSERQNAGGVTGYVEFSYNVGEIRIARSLLQNVLSVPMFEQEFAKVVVSAYVKAMDKEIMNGVAGNNQFEGILTEAAKVNGRIPAANIIEFTDNDMADWTKWQSLLFAKIPIAMRALKPEFVMTANTYEANIKTLKDSNNRPVYAETYNPVDGAETATFKGREVVFVEDDVLENFNDANNGEYFGMYWVPEQAYAVNTNMEFTVMDYFDHETNQYVKKVIVVNDGKILDPKYLYLLKKKVSG